MNAPIEPWLYCEHDEDLILHGNREAYQLLKAKVESLLESEGEVDSVTISERNVEISLLKLRLIPQLVEPPMSVWQKLLGTLCLLFFLSIPVSILLLAVFGLAQLIHLFS